jgi:hypothetical protein
MQLTVVVLAVRALLSEKVSLKLEDIMVTTGHPT